MDSYKGIPIAEYKILVFYGSFIFIFVVAIITLAFYLYVLLSGRNKKEKERILKLREKAATDEIAKKRLERIERKTKRKRKRNKQNLILDVSLLILLIAVCITTLCYGIIPPWTDYIKKDYEIYTGEIKVYQHMKHSRIELDDGTVLWGRADFVEEDTYGTVVYSKRSKIVIGGQK